MRKPFVLAVRIAILDDEILSLDLTERLQLHPKRVEGVFRVGGRIAGQEADPYLLCLLRLDGERRGEEAACDHPEERSSLQYDPSDWPHFLGGTGLDGQRVELTPGGEHVDYDFLEELIAGLLGSGGRGARALMI